MKKLPTEFDREVCEIQSLIYDDACDELHELGKKIYWDELEDAASVISEKYDELFEKFNKKYPNHSARAFNKVFSFMLAEGKDMAKEIDLAVTA